MIAPREDVLHILSMGILQQEREILQQYATETGSELVLAKDDLDLWNHARNGQFDLCILGQTEEIPDPSYLIWLLKGLANHSKVILVLSTMTSDIEERLERFHASFSLTRPFTGAQLIKAIDQVLNTREERRDGLWASISRFLPSRRHVKVLNDQ